jgi:predicted phosphoadenosine phosphosulfate sulfurtransferase
VNVFDAATERLRVIFSEFDNVYVSFSGGKDSGVLLNLCIDYVRKNLPGRRLGVFHVDYEAQYQMTTDYVDATFASNADVLDVYRICLPIAASCATSMTKPYWIPWDADDKALWVRAMPTHSGVINESNHEFPWFEKGMKDYDLQERFSTWLHKKKGAKKTACLVGIRTQESQHRWNALHGQKKRDQSRHDGIIWTQKIAHGVFNCYPVFDWKVEDVWTANARMEWTYNKLYDLFYMAGVPLGSQRVASPFHECGMEALKLYKVIDPANWGRMVGRTNGVNFAGLYGGTTAMGWKSIKLPPGLTWKQYMEFLLSTLPEEVAANYKKKLVFSKEYWRSKGGSLSPDTIRRLAELGIEHKVSDKPNNHAVFKDHLPVTMEYMDDIDIPDFRLIPTYKRMCICIIKNDLLCKYMGFGATKTETQIRANASKKYSQVYTDKTARKWSNAE